ncbi:hypothetical protein HYV81_04990 [Candidatus Woesearchaeota archaeon]|nr:hypothetical protein [Candidatus Woesearchaeota archaeon]
MGAFDSIANNLRQFYDRYYKLLLIIPVAMLLFSFFQIGYQLAATGDFMHRDVSLKGGITVTIPVAQEYSESAIRAHFAGKFPGIDLATRIITGTEPAILLQADIDPDSPAADQFFSEVEGFFKVASEQYSVEVTGPTLGRSFFMELLLAVLVAFALMAIVVFISFRKIVPSLAVLLAVVCNVLFALAMVNALDIRIGAGGIAAFLMLIGYSVDTDILLSSRVLKRSEGSVLDRVIDASKTGIMMTATAIAAIGIALFLTQSDIIRQIMIILLFGLLADIPNTWIQNAGILRVYLERKGAA